jgi:hypothetical protein
LPSLVNPPQMHYLLIMKMIINFQPILKIVGLTLVATVAASGTASADRRAFTRTNEYQTQQEGAVEIEYWLTHQQAKFDAASSRTFEQQIEIEYGLTDHWDIALYQKFQQVADGPFSYSETKLETRYRFCERGENPVDILGYLELARPQAGSAWKIEPKLVLSKDFAKTTVALNLIPELVIAREKEDGTTKTKFEFEPGWALGATFEASPKWKVGAETWGAIEHPFESAEREVSAYAGPSVGFAPSSKFWLALTTGVGLTEDAKDFEVRSIIAIGL